MQTHSYLYEDKQWNKALDNSLDSENTLIICFGSTNFDDIKDGFADISNIFKQSKILGCSTAGEIYDDLVYDSTLSVVVMKFEKTQLKLVNHECNDSKDSFNAGKNISKELFADDLKSIFVLSDGLNINGSQLTKGLSDSIGIKYYHHRWISWG